MLGKSIVTTIVSRNSHNSTCSVAGKHIITYINRNVFTCNRIHCIRTGEHTRHLFINHAFTFCLVLNFIKVSINSSFLFVANNHFNILAFRGKHHECNTENSIGTSGENLQIKVFTCYREKHFCSLTISNPIALSFLYGITPFHSVKVTKKTTGISTNTQTPLIHQLLFHRITTTQRYSFAHFIVGKHCTKFRTPIHHCITKVSNAIVHEHIVLFLLAVSIPLFSSEI